MSIISRIADSKVLPGTSAGSLPACGLLEVIGLGYNQYWVANAGITNDIEALRAICLYHADWWNGTAWPVIVAAFGGDQSKAFAYVEHVNRCGSLPRSFQAKPGRRG